jgi:GWxTD domain-containing protein
MSAYERNRLDRIDRVLRPRDASGVHELAPAALSEFQRQYWLSVNPLWSVADIDPRAEFLARISYAELRWTVDELSKRGADSDRGNIYIRYGPPDRIATNDGNSTWSYEYSRLNFRFHGAPTYGTAYFGDYGRALVVMDSMPSLWDNMHSMVIDSLPVQAARFRATGDSMDVLFAARAPAEDIRHANDVKSPIRSDFWLLKGAYVTVLRDSAPQTGDGVRTFTLRLPFDDYSYRFEATAIGSIVAGRATGQLNAPGSGADGGLPLHGFAVSDLLLATRAESRTPAPRRWTDLDLTPVAGPLTRDTEFSLVWENYDFGESGGQSKYGVSVTISAEHTLPEKITAKIVGSLNGMVGRSDYVDGVRFRFERAVSFAPAIVDQVSLSLDTTPPGSYRVTLEVTDHVSGKVTERTRRIIVK